MSRGLLLLASLALALAAGSSGCRSRIIQPEPLVVRSIETGEMSVVHYPEYVAVHHSDSFWDAHQVKDNLVGLLELDVVRVVDLGADVFVPGPPARPVENGIEWVKDGYAQLPDCAAVRIVGGFFSAAGFEKTCVIYVQEICEDPTRPEGYATVTRIVYLTDWVQETLGEFSTIAGYFVPWSGPFIPLFVTRPVNRLVDWLQDGTIRLYVYIGHKVSTFVDRVIDWCEAAWARVVGFFCRYRKRRVGEFPLGSYGSG